MSTGLYIHIPFCKQKCKYCDFASFAGREFLLDDYLRALACEAALSPVRRFETLYVGGGTPSLLSLAQLEQLVRLVEDNFGPVKQFAESTLEANPESLTLEKLRFLRSAGFNRLSIGLQSLHDDELRLLGRVHNASAFLRAYEAACKAGFENINVDLIAGLPGQTLEKFNTSLQGVLALAPTHLSVYGLQIEEGTVFFEQGIVCDQLLMRRMLEQTRAQLLAAGFHHYEISNFARRGFEAKHNIHYWQYGPYIGLGSSAVSFTSGRRYQNTPDINAYIHALKTGKSPVVFTEQLTGQAREGEKLMVGLRQLDGVELSPEQEQYFGKEIDKHIQNGLLRRCGKKVQLSEQGLYVANEVFYSFVAPFDV